MNQALERVIARSEIYDALMRYCRGVDRLDKDLILSAFHEGAYDDHGPYRSHVVDLAEDLMKRKPAETAWSVHTVCNHLVEFEGDMTAISEAVLVSYQLPLGDSAVQFFLGRYLDRFEKRDGEWKIAFRRLVHDFSASMTLGEWAMASLPIAEMAQGGRGGSDPVSPELRSTLFPPQAPS